MWNLYDYIRIISVLVAFVILASRDVKTWITADAILCLVAGIFMLLKPTFFIDLEINLSGIKFDPGHLFLARTYAIALIYISSYLYLLRNSKDVNVTRSLLWVRAVGAGLLGARACYTHWRYASMVNNQHLVLGVFMGTLYMLIAFIQLYRFGMDLPARGKVGGSVSTCFKIDAIYTFIFSVPNVILPSSIFMVMNITTDSLHCYLFALFGALDVGNAMICWFAQGFTSNVDKRAVFCSRLTYMVLGLVIAIYSRFVENYFVTAFDLVFVLLGVIPGLIANSYGLHLLKNKTSSSSQNSYNLRSRN